MRNTISCALPADADRDAVTASVHAMRDRVAAYVPGYRLRTDPIFDEDKLIIIRGGRGGGDWLPPYAGNLDIMTAAAVQVGEELARLRQAEAAGGEAGADRPGARP